MEESKSILRAIIAQKMAVQKISQYEMAKRLGMQQQNFNAFINGRRAIPFDKLEEILIILKIIKEPEQKRC